jgi:hypothetical protein
VANDEFIASESGGEEGVADTVVAAAAARTGTTDNPQTTGDKTGTERNKAAEQAAREAAARKAVKDRTICKRWRDSFWLRLRLRLGAMFVRRTGPVVMGPWRRKVYSAIIVFVVVAPVLHLVGLHIHLLTSKPGSIIEWILYGIIYCIFLALVFSFPLWRWHYPGSFGDHFKKNSVALGVKLDKWPWFPAALTGQEGALEHFLGEEEPFLIIKGALLKRHPLPNLVKSLREGTDAAARKRFLAHVSLIVAGLIAATHTELRYKEASRKKHGLHIYQDFFTGEGQEKNRFSDGDRSTSDVGVDGHGSGRDLHMRYRTATPERPLANTGGISKAARIIVFACIENPISDPIYLIKARDVVSKIKEDTKRHLSDEAFVFFDFWDIETIDRGDLGSSKKILYDGDPGQWWLSFDPNRFVSRNSDNVKIDGRHLAAVGDLMKCIEETAEDGSARKIVLERGDILIVDNYRALTRRQEHGYVYFYLNAKNFMRRHKVPPVRWLRMFYGFPPEPAASRDGDD